MKVQVRAKDGQELMPTTIEKANELIRKNEAEIIEVSPLVIRMLKNTKRYTQDLLGDSYDLKKSNDYTISLGKTNIHGDIKDISWSLESKREQFIDDSTGLFAVGNNSDILVNNIITSIEDIETIKVVYNNLLSNNYLQAKNITGYAQTIEYIAETAAVIKLIMMARFQLLSKEQTNKFQDLKNVNLVRYSLFDKEYDWDDIFTVVQDDKYYPIAMSEMYENLIDDTVKSYTLANSIDNKNIVTKSDIQEVEGVYNPKNILFVIENLDEIIYSATYKLADKIRYCLGAIVRLGRTAGINLVITSKKPNALFIDIINNCGIKVMCDQLSSAESLILFDKDVKIKKYGRAAISLGYNNNIYEFQMYNTCK